jgi:hypothetical protein
MIKIYKTRNSTFFVSVLLKYGIRILGLFVFLELFARAQEKIIKIFPKLKPVVKTHSP